MLRLLPPAGDEVTIDPTQVRERTDPVSAMPPMAGILNPRQLRDVVEFLSGLKDKNGK